MPVETPSTKDQVASVRRGKPAAVAARKARTYTENEVARTLGLSRTKFRSWREGLPSDPVAPDVRRFTEGDVKQFKTLLGKGGSGSRARKAKMPPDVDLTSLLKEKALTLPGKQRRLAELLLSSPEETVFGTLRSVANWSGLSTLTVLRFTKALGFDGYHSFQNAARESYLKRAQSPRPASISKSSAVIATLEQHRAHLEELSQRLRTSDLNAVCERLEKARRIIICSSAAAQDFGSLLAKQLLYAGFASDRISSSGVNSKVALQQVGTGDVLIGIHLSLLYEDIYQVFELARSRGAATVIIGGTPISRLARIANHFLYAHAEGKAVQFSFVGLAALSEALVAQLIERNPKKAAAVSKVILDMALEERLSGAAASRNT